MPSVHIFLELALFLLVLLFYHKIPPFGPDVFIIGFFVGRRRQENDVGPVLVPYLYGIEPSCRNIAAYSESRPVPPQCAGYLFPVKGIYTALILAPVHLAFVLPTEHVKNLY